MPTDNLVLILTEMRKLCVKVVRVETQFEGIRGEMKRLRIEGKEQQVILLDNIKEVHISIKEEEIARIKRDDDLDTKIDFALMREVVPFWNKKKLSALTAILSALSAGLYTFWEKFL